MRGSGQGLQDVVSPKGALVVRLGTLGASRVSFLPSCLPQSKLNFPPAFVSGGSGFLLFTPPGKIKTKQKQNQDAPQDSACAPPDRILMASLHPRYLISLGADRDATNDDGDLPSDLIDPDFKDLVELFQGTKMD